VAGAGRPDAVDEALPLVAREPQRRAGAISGTADEHVAAGQPGHPDAPGDPAACGGAEAAGHGMPKPGVPFPRQISGTALSGQPQIVTS
jgi:hypothetical protein